MATIGSQKITPHLWFAERALEAVRFYVSLFPGSRIDSQAPVPADTPSGPAGSVQVIAYTLAGQKFVAMNAGPLDPFNHAVSFAVSCEDQAEIDRLWTALSEGGTIEQCGWVRDRYGLCWQVVPARLGELLGGPDGAGATRAMKALLGMRKIEIAALERAYRGG